MTYTLPTSADLKMAYPEFAAVDDVTVQSWIDRVSGPGGDVDESWSEPSYPLAIEAAAAHRMARARVAGLVTSASGAYAAAGVTGFKTASVDITLDAATVARSSSGGWDSTGYGLDYLEQLRRRGHGMGVTSVDCWPCA